MNCFRKASTRNWLLILMLISLIWGCGVSNNESRKSPTDARVQSADIVAVSYPHEFLAKRLVGDELTVWFPAENSDNPATWRPGRNEILAMQQSKLIVANGIGAAYANWLLTVSLPESKICNTASRGLSLDDYIQVDDIRLVHSHGPEGEHSHPMTISQTWLDPKIFLKQANYLAKQLPEKFEQQADTIATNREQLEQELQAVITSYDELKSKLNGQTILTSDPSLKFLSRFLGLTDLHFNWKEFEEPEQLKQLSEKLASLEQRPLLMLFPNEAPGATIQEKLQNESITWLAIETLESKTELDYPARMGQILNQLTQAIPDFKTKN